MTCSVSVLKAISFEKFASNSQCCVNSLRSPERAMLVITHYQRLLDYIVPDRVHVLSGGRIVRSGGKDLALELEEKGYGWVEGVQA